MERIPTFEIDRKEPEIATLRIFPIVKGFLKAAEKM